MTPGDHVPALCATTYDAMFNSHSNKDAAKVAIEKAVSNKVQFTIIP